MVAVGERLDLVIVAFGFSPCFGPGVARPLSWVNHLASRGHRVRVLTAPPEVQERAGVFRQRNPALVHPSVEVVRLDGLGIDRVAQEASRMRLRRLFDAVGLTPEGGWGLNAAIWLATNVNSKTVVISTYTPSAALLAALGARSLTNFIWIADYRDPWLLRDNPLPTKLHLSLASGLDKLIHRCADALVYTSYRDMQNALHEYGPLSARHLVVRNGVDGDGFERSGSTSKAATILYAGNLYAAPEARPAGLAMLDRFYSRKIRYDYRTYSLVPLIRAVSSAREDMPEITIKVVGSATEEVVERASKMAGLTARPEWIDVIGVVDKARVAALSNEAGALYLPVAGRMDGRASGWVPQKLFEMLAGDRPILVSAPPGEATDLLAGRGGVFLLRGNDSDSSIVTAALRSSTTRPAGKIMFKRSSQVLQIEALARRLLIAK